MAFDYNHSVISRLEDKWLDPDYDIATGRYNDYDEDEIDDAVNYILGLDDEEEDDD